MIGRRTVPHSIDQNLDVQMLAAILLI
eukprot:SAG31_NODE_32750_length_352_cov_0.612648_1_plen_26_part_01